DAALRYGGPLEADGNYRLYGKYFDRKHTSTANGTTKDDAWYESQIGFLSNWNRAADQVTVEGNAYKGREGQPLPGTIAISGVNLALGIISISGENMLARWEHALEGGSKLMLQAYYDRTERTVPPTFAENLDIVDVQLQHALVPFGIHAVVWGGEYRYAIDRVSNSDVVAFLPAHVNHAWESLFLQDEMTLSNDLRLTIGARIDRNDYTGNEFLPSVRLAWKLDS